MPVPIILTSNKSDFSNYFSDNITFPKNAEMALTKAVMSIPVAVNQYVQMPFSIDLAGELATPCFSLTVDGIQNNITWQDIYDSYTVLDIADGFEPLTVAQFYENSTQLPLNNFVVWRSGLTPKKRGNICEIIARAFNAKFSFYNIRAAPEMIYNGYDNFVVDGTLTVNATVLQVENVLPFSMDLGFAAIYNPNAMAVTPNLEFCTAANATLWSAYLAMTVTDNPAGCNIISTGGAGTTAVYDAIAELYFSIDPNGGIMQFDLKTVPDNSEFVVGFRNQLDIQIGLAAGVASLSNEDFVFGIRFKKVAGDITYQIIDGLRDGVNGAGDVVSDIRPVEELRNPCDIGNTFSIGLVRTAINDGQFRYAFGAYRNVANDDWDDDNNELIYRSNKYINSPLAMGQIFAANLTGCEIENLRVSVVSGESFEQINRANFDGTANAYIGAMQIDTAYDLTDPNLQPEITMFFKALGFNLDFATANRAANNFGDVNNSVVSGTTPFIYRHVINRPKGIGLQNKTSNAVVLGENRVEKLYRVRGTTPNQYISYKNANSSIPRMLDVKIKDVTIQDYNGQLVGTPQFTTTTVTRDICHIPVPPEFLDKAESFDLNLSYEPYNLIYKQLGNTHKFPINQLSCEVSFKNFVNNSENNIPVINGTLKIELHVRPSDYEIEYD